MPDEDRSEYLRQQVAAAHEANAPLKLVGGGSKEFYGRLAAGSPLDVSGHRGVVDYEPTELVITARGGTPLEEIENLLADNGQMLGFEPAHFGKAATLGGTIACGLSGPRGAFAGLVRDCVLGVRLINGRGRILRFGGQVMKNVAGFDVSRLNAGALGTLGILLEISLKVLPRPEREATVAFEMTAEDALVGMNRWRGQHWPLSAACHVGRWLYLRLEGSAGAIRASRMELGGEVLNHDGEFWTDLREQRLAFFEGERPLWRISVPPAARRPMLEGDWLIDWGGALRWLRTEASGETVFEAVRKAGGHATLFRHGDRSGMVFQPLPPRMQALQSNLKKAFDPRGILNPGRMYEGW